MTEVSKLTSSSFPPHRREWQSSSPPWAFTGPGSILLQAIVVTTDGGSPPSEHPPPTQSSSPPELKLRSILLQAIVVTTPVKARGASSSTAVGNSSSGKGELSSQAPQTLSFPFLPVPYAGNRPHHPAVNRGEHRPPLPSGNVRSAMEAFRRRLLRRPPLPLYRYPMQAIVVTTDAKASEHPPPSNRRHHPEQSSGSILLQTGSESVTDRRVPVLDNIKTWSSQAPP